MSCEFAHRWLNLFRMASVNQSARSVRGRRGAFGAGALLITACVLAARRAANSRRLAKQPPCASTWAPAGRSLRSKAGGGAQSMYSALLASAAPRHQRDPPAPDLVEIFHEQLAFIDTQYPRGTPLTTRAEHLEDLACVRKARLERLVQLEIADRIVAMVCRLRGSIFPAVAVVLVGRHVGAW